MSEFLMRFYSKSLIIKRPAKINVYVNVIENFDEGASIRMKNMC